MEVWITLSVIFMIIYVYSKRGIFGSLAWTLFALACLSKVPDYIVGGDYYNTTVFTLGFLFFLLLAYSVFKSNSAVFVEVTSFSALACLFYFPFAFNLTLKHTIIYITAHLTASLGNMLGYPMEVNGAFITIDNKSVEIILACTAIESMALFAGATLGIRANASKRIKAFVASVPVIYVLNLLRNVFVMVSFAYEWFGENSFYIAHHIVAKILSTIALILIAFAVFRILPELADLIYSLKNEIIRSVRA